MKNNTWPGWECVRQLGAGSFGKVYEIQKIENGKIYKAALKVITIPQNEAEIENAYSEGMTKENVTTYFKSFVNDITNEFALMSDLKGYTNIVSYEDHMVVKHEEGIGWDILIRMELLTPLQKWVETHPMDESTIIRLGCDICRALELCHKKKIIHRDIKPENIFVNSNGDFKLGDFGIARVAEKTTSIMSQKGTFTYMAPEVYKGNYYNETVDIYSLGIVLYRFLNNNRTPFLPMDQITYNDRVTSLERRMSGEEIPAPINGNEKLKQAILMAVHYDIEKRFQNVTAFRKALEKCGCFEENDFTEGNSSGYFNESNDEKTQKVSILFNDREDATNDSKYDDQTVRINSTVIQNGKQKKKILPIIVIGFLIVCGICAVFFGGGASTNIPASTNADYEQKEAIGQAQKQEIRESNNEASFEAPKAEEEIIAPEIEITGELKAGCSTHALLVGDTVEILVAAGDFLFDNSAEGLSFYSDNTNIATVSSDGIVTGISEGVANILVMYEDMETSYQIYVTKVDDFGHKGASIEAEYDNVSLGMYDTVTIDLILQGNYPEKFKAVCYSSGEIAMYFEWGELQDNILPLSVNPLLRTEDNEGKITILIYPQDNPKQIVAATSVDIIINN